MTIAEKLLGGRTKLAVVGLGYVGLPMAIAFAEKVSVIGYDVNTEKINQYKSFIDPTGEVGSQKLSETTMFLTSDASFLQEASFIVVSVPTPVNGDETPDLTPLTKACKTIGENMQPGAVVMFESTVYPGVTEEICVPILEKASGKSCGVDFFVGYSPERVNPGDKLHRFENIRKIVSAADPETAREAAAVYEIVVTSGTYVAESIKVAEAAKLVENAQRDVNIAFMNEVSMALHRMDINTLQVINAMNTKWNALKFYPGLVGGHCIGIDPYYFLFKARKVDFRPRLIRQARDINDDMAFYVAESAVVQLIKADKPVKGAKVCVMGITYKEDCPDIRNTMVTHLISRLEEYGAQVCVCDPVADKHDALSHLGIELQDIENASSLDCVIFAVAHSQFKSLTAEQLWAMYAKTPSEEGSSEGSNKKILLDVKNIFSRKLMEESGFIYWSL
ncbi:MAG: nucleotide sugar dehydrogenase [Christensenellales bacterium]|jgi:UDP-N-acetyl-D-galactosamine dehydrogenase